MEGVAATPSSPQTTLYRSRSSTLDKRGDAHVQPARPQSRPLQACLDRLDLNVNLDLADIPILILSFSTAIVDALTLYTISLMTANLTGNITYTALEAVNVLGDTPFQGRASQSGACFGAFVGGVILQGHLAHWVGPQKRWFLAATTLFQAAITFVVGALVHVGTIVVARDKDAGHNVGLFVSLLSFSFGAQVACSRFVKVPQVPIVAITLAVADLGIDRDIFKLRNRARDRRLAFVVLVLLGSMVGGYAASKHSFDAPLFVAAVLNVFVAVVWLTLPPERPATGPPDQEESRELEEEPKLSRDHDSGSQTRVGTPTWDLEQGV